MRRLLELATLRLREASGPPSVSAWLSTLIVGTAYLLVAAPLGYAAGLVDPAGPWLTPLELLKLSLRVLVLPALAEEVVFRALLNPHPVEYAGSRTVLVAGVLSLTAYVLMHPLAGLLYGAGAPFLDPAFLLLAALLGTCCLLLYRLSGSLWPPVVLHWLVVTAWLALGGTGLLA